MGDMCGASSDRGFGAARPRSRWVKLAGSSLISSFLDVTVEEGKNVEMFGA